MEILSVTLKNFKTHADRQFIFQPGTNAICGENGAGKTSILEAIAWTLFNYRGAYKNEDLVRNGANSAQAIVRLVSSRDGRTYEIQRCTSRGYALYDPQLDQRLPYKHIDEEIMPWLRQHMGVAPGTDLGRLFANTIGVPQGTFTADFLQPAEKRKPIFDAILKVEEYQHAYRQGLALEKYAKTEVEKLEAAIAQYEERLADWESLKTRRQEVQTAIAQDQATLQQLQAELTQLQAQKDALEQCAKQVQALETELQQVTAQMEVKQQANRMVDASLQRARQAVETCHAHQASYQAFLQVEETLKNLDQQAKQRQALISQREAQQKRLTNGDAHLARLSVQMEHLTQTQADLAGLQPLIQQQAELEQNQQHAIAQLQQFQTCELERQRLLAQLNKLETASERLDQEIQQIQVRAAGVRQIPDLEKRRDRLQEQLSRIQAAQQFEAELQALVTVGQAKRDRHQQDVHAACEVLRELHQAVPVLAADSLNAALATIQAGVDLNTELLDALRSILADLSEQVSVAQLSERLKTVRSDLDVAYQQRTELATLDARQVQHQELVAELQEVRSRLSELQDQLAQRPQWEQQRSHLDAQLAQLNDPRGRSRLLQQQLQQRDEIQAAYEKSKLLWDQIQQSIHDLSQQLEDFSELDDQVEQQKQRRQSHQPGYLAYLQQEPVAQQLPTLEQEYKAAIAQLQRLEARRQELQTELAALRQTYDADEWQRVETQYRHIRSQADRLEGSLPQRQQLFQELDHRLRALQEVAIQRDQAQAHLKECNRVKRFISFARKVYKEAGPRITERYVHNISREADRLFRELLNRQNVSLEWTRDYEIVIQEGAHSRRFINLSGGEQMCAALAVRLALLRILADIDVAFFDEPTTNMDRSRRESLAEAIANIRTFRQLFVISHDDTFEKVTENIILVERDA